MTTDHTPTIHLNRPGDLQKELPSLLGFDPIGHTVITFFKGTQISLTLTAKDTSDLTPAQLLARVLAWQQQAAATGFMVLGYNGADTTYTMLNDLLEQVTSDTGCGSQYLVKRTDEADTWICRCGESFDVDRTSMSQLEATNGASPVASRDVLAATVCRLPDSDEAYRFAATLNDPGERDNQYMAVVNDPKAWLDANLTLARSVDPTHADGALLVSIAALGLYVNSQPVEARTMVDTLVPPNGLPICIEIVYSGIDPKVVRQGLRNSVLGVRN